MLDLERYGIPGPMTEARYLLLMGLGIVAALVYEWHCANNVAGPGNREEVQREVEDATGRVCSSDEHNAPSGNSQKIS